MSYPSPNSSPVMAASERPKPSVPNAGEVAVMGNAEMSRRKPVLPCARLSCNDPFCRFDHLED
jgi:hypothetical protein